MRTKFKNLGITFILSAMGFGLNASESGLYASFNSET